MAMEEDNSEHLFLMECHVSELHFHSPETFDEPKPGAREKVCVTVSFLHFAELLLCDETSEERMSGKSFLFALPKKTLNRYATSVMNSNAFVVILKVYRADSNGIGHKHSSLGQTSVSLGDKFADMSQAVIFESKMPPTSFLIDENCRLKNKNEIEIGTLKAFLRMTCFGKMIVTHLHAQSGAERELPTDLMRKITALTERHISAMPTGQENADSARPNVLATSTPKNTRAISNEEFQKKVKKKIQNIELKGKDWCDVLGCPMIDFEEPVETKDMLRPSEDVAAPSYEEVTARVNGHLLFFQVLKTERGEKREADAGQGEEMPNERNAENGEGSKARAKKSCKKTGKSDPSDEGDSRGINSRRKVLIPKDSAKKLFKDEEGSRTPTTQCMLEKMKEGQEICVRNVGDNCTDFSSQKEVFSLKIGKQYDSRGMQRPKVILKILSPKTKADIEEEDALTELEEKRLEKLEAKTKLKEFVTKETQCCDADIIGVPNKDPKQAKKKASVKQKKGKKR